MRRAAVHPSLVASFNSGVSLNCQVGNFAVPKLVGKQRHNVTCACASTSTSPSFGIGIGRRALLSTATAASFLMPFPSNSNWASATATDQLSLLQEEIGKVLSKGKAAGLLRLVFHDAGTFDADDKTGGMNGSIVYELDRPENRGLDKSVKILEKAKGQVDIVNEVSWADLIAVAGAEAIHICGGPKISVQLGRIDAKGPDPGGKLPQETLDAIAMKQVFLKKGFSVQELVALSGAHTLGSKGFGNPMVFDNSYYKVLVEKPGEGGMSSMIGLPSDRALAQDEECMRWITKYGKDEQLFFKDFEKAYMKLVNSGAKWTT